MFPFNHGWSIGSHVLAEASFQFSPILTTVERTFKRHNVFSHMLTSVEPTFKWHKVSVSKVCLSLCKLSLHAQTLAWHNHLNYLLQQSHISEFHPAPTKTRSCDYTQFTLCTLDRTSESSPINHMWIILTSSPVVISQPRVATHHFIMSYSFYQLFCLFTKITWLLHIQKKMFGVYCRITYIK